MSKARSPEVTEGQILLFSTLFFKLAYNSGTRRATAPRKANSIALLMLFCQHVLDLIWSKSTVWPLELKLQKTFFLRIFFFCYNFWLSEGTTSTLNLPASCWSCQDASNELEFDIKRSFWKLMSSWPDRKSSYCRSVDLYSHPKHIYGVFSVLSGVYQKLLPKNCWWPFMTLATWRGVTGLNIPTQVVRSPCKCFEWFSSKRGAFHFFHIGL